MRAGAHGAIRCNIGGPRSPWPGKLVIGSAGTDDSIGQSTKLYFCTVLSSRQVIFSQSRLVVCHILANLTLFTQLAALNRDIFYFFADRWVLGLRPRRPEEEAPMTGKEQPRLPEHQRR